MLDVDVSRVRQRIRQKSLVAFEYEGEWRLPRFQFERGFDHQIPDRRGAACVQHRSVLYCGGNAVTCLAEVFQQTRRVDRVRNAPWLAVFELKRPVQLLDLTGRYPTRVGASMAINSGSRVRAREWACSFYEACEELDGIHYASSMHANEPAGVRATLIQQ